MSHRLAVLVALLLVAGTLPGATAAQWSPGGLTDAGYTSTAMTGWVSKASCSARYMSL